MAADPPAEADQVARLADWRATLATARRRRRGARRAGRGGAGGRQHHAAPRSPRRRPASPPANGRGVMRSAFGEYRAPTGVAPEPSNRTEGLGPDPRGGRRLGRAARPQAQAGHRQAGARRPFQRRRTDRHARPRLRHGDRLCRHPPDPGRDRRAGPRRRRRMCWACRSCRAATSTWWPRSWPSSRRAGLERHAGRRRRHHPRGDAARLRAMGVAAVYTPKDFELNRIMLDIVRLAGEIPPRAA